MRSRLTKAAAAIALAAALSVGGATAASAYTPGAPAGGTVSIAPGASQTFDYTALAAGLPAEDTTVTFTLTGEGVTDASLATIVRTAVTSTQEVKPRDAAIVTVTLPADAAGVYSLTAVGSTSGTPLPTTTVDSGVALGGAAGGGVSAPGLPSTGENSMALLGLWVGGGALVLAGGALVVGNTVRRQRQHVDA